MEFIVQTSTPQAAKIAEGQGIRADRVARISDQQLMARVRRLMKAGVDVTLRFVCEHPSETVGVAEVVLPFPVPSGFEPIEAEKEQTPYPDVSGLSFLHVRPVDEDGELAANGGVTVCYSKQQYCTPRFIDVGLAWCSDEDCYNKATGRKLAATRYRKRERYQVKLPANYGTLEEALWDHFARDYLED